MDTSAKVPAFWNRFTENMYLRNSITAKVRISDRSMFRFGRVGSSEGLPEITRASGLPSDYLVTLQLKAIPFLEQFLGAKKVASGFYPIGGVSVLNLQERPAILLPNPFDTLVLHVTQSALDEIAYAHKIPRVDQLVWPHGHLDPVVYHLGQTLVASLDQPNHTSKVFLDHILHALNCHIVSSYGGLRISTPRSRGGLSPLQMRRATEFLEAHLDGNINLDQVARVCDLSVSHFARAFRQTFRRPPYRWLIERRVARAKDLIATSHLPLAQIAIQSGFSDQGALNRSFKRIIGLPPGKWRGETTRGRRGSGS
ncbi:Transcriptional regulator, AraC family [Acidisarcina polymorpha]|uniref:Transcriptional regulator, AraC family n=1 Tax=Acidisarcina polymorpha TaxID=2211140 RepID=A0A2Z5G6V4_9BACT|nr:Transcriptional regulator, AraC family [Acidisarcina polymorpha]